MDVCGDNKGVLPPAQSTAVPSSPITLAKNSKIVASSAFTLTQLAAQLDKNPPSQHSVSVNLMEHVQHCLKMVYGVLELRPMQHLLFETMLVKKKLQVLFVDKTARGKSHDMRLLATINKGVHVYVCPLLVLMADIVLKFQEGN